MALAGYRIGCNFSSGSYLYVDDLITKPNSQSQGLGTQMMRHLEMIVGDAGCRHDLTHSSEVRLGAHRFYLKKGFNIHAHYFDKELD